MITAQRNNMKEKLWAALILCLMLLFWAFALGTPVFCDKQPRSGYTLLTCDQKDICVRGR
jgi:hypothetical protein